VSHGKAEGSGLGLAIAKQFVEDHGGKIYLDERIENGTLLKITCPLPFRRKQTHWGLQFLSTPGTCQDV
jgi:signal transduction histidine kinase